MFVSKQYPVLSVADKSPGQRDLILTISVSITALARRRFSVAVFGIALVSGNLYLTKFVIITKLCRSLI
jgi:hypothetical protein